jgi:hypothetical protein
MHTCEDVVELLVSSQYTLEKSDINLIHSLARQTMKGVAYTDRQYALAKEKVLFYRDQIESLGNTNIDLCIETLRLPLRKIDRSRWIKLVDSQGPNRVYEGDKSPFIAVRFIFQKKLISNIDSIKQSLGVGDYDKEEKIHYFPFSEQAAYEIVSNFNESNGFDVDPQLKEYYEKLLDMKNNKQKYIPGIYKFELKNIDSKCFEYAISSIGTPDADNLYKFYDRKDELGLDHFDQEDLTHSLRDLTSLSQKIVSRKLNRVFVSSKEYTINNVAETMLELDRFPLLVVLNHKTCYDELVQFHKAFNGFIEPDECAVLFRLDNDAEGAEFNHYIHTNNLNNPVDNSTKIVYISNNKVPKPLLKSSWTADAAISTTSARSYGDKNETFVNELDLIMYYDSEMSQMMRFKSNGIQKI